MPKDATPVPPTTEPETWIDPVTGLLMYEPKYQPGELCGGPRALYVVSRPYVSPASESTTSLSTPATPPSTDDE